jgi:hypothetical protein
MDSLGGRTARALNGEALLAAVRWVVDARIFDELKFHGNTTWKPVDLILLTVVWAWSEASTLTGAFDEAHRWSQQALSRAAVSTYQGLMGALVGSTGRLLPLLWQRLQALMEKHGGDHWRIGCWLPLAVDGSRIRALKQTFGRRKLRSKRPDRALVELDWSLVGLTIIQLFAVKEQIQFGEPPEQCSVSLAIRIVRETVDRWHETPAAGETFRLRLRAAIIDDYQRTTSKKARYRTDSKDKPSAKKPKLLNATKQHKQWLAKLLAAAA